MSSLKHLSWRSQYLKGEIVKILFQQQMKHYNNMGIWPQLFADTPFLHNSYESAEDRDDHHQQSGQQSEDDDSQQSDDDDIMQNTNKNYWSS